MLHYAVVFFVIAIIAALFGFGGIAAGAAGIAKILFCVFLVLAVISLLAGRRAAGFTPNFVNGGGNGCEEGDSEVSKGRECEGREDNARAKEGNAQVGRVRKESNEPKAGHRHRSFGSTRRGREGPQKEGFYDPQ